MYKLSPPKADRIAAIVAYECLGTKGWGAALGHALGVPIPVMAAMGYSLNNISLFGLVLAIGIVVDDAIVVVEAVEHHIEHGLSPKDATLKAMEEVTAPVIGIALVLSAVFIPVAFVGGLTGRMYQQFALTIAVSVILSAFSALTLSPALACLLLKAPVKGGKVGLLGRFFGALAGRAGWFAAPAPRG